MSDQAQRLANGLKLARAAKGWTQDKLAADTGISRSVIAHIESKRKVPSSATLETLAASLGVSVRKLYSDKAPPPKETRSDGYQLRAERISSAIDVYLDAQRIALFELLDTTIPHSRNRGGGE